MVTYSDKCYGCATESYPCLGNACPNRHVKIFICDKCGEEFETLYYSPFSGDELCLDCIEEGLEKVE